MLTLIEWGTALGLKREGGCCQKRWVWRKSKSKRKIPVFSTYPVTTPLPSSFVGQPEGTASIDKSRLLSLLRQKFFLQGTFSLCEGNVPSVVQQILKILQYVWCLVRFAKMSCYSY